MNRRKFILASGSTILTGTSIGSLQRPALGLEFELSAAPNEETANIDSILVEFTNFEVTPSYLDERNGLDINVKLAIEGENSVNKGVSGISFTNGQTIDSAEIKNKTGQDLSQVVIDDLDKSGSNLQGNVYIRVNHLDVSEQTYKQSFDINPRKIVDNFEDDNLIEYSAHTNDFNIVDGNIPKTQEIEPIAGKDVTSGEAHIYSLQGDGLPNYPKKGHIFSCYLTTDTITGGKDDLGFMYGAGSSSVTGYGVHHEPSGSNGEAKLVIWDNYPSGNFTKLITPSIPQSTGVFEYVVEWHDGTGSEPDNTHVLTVYSVDSSLNRTKEVASGSAVDNTFASNSGVGFVCNNVNTDSTASAGNYQILGNV